MKKILITGGCGFLGQHLLYELLKKKGFKIKVIDLKDSQYKVYDFRDKVECAFGKDITDYNKIKDEFKNIDIVFHLAGFVSFWKGHEKQLVTVNALGTKNVLQACLDNKVKKVIHVSSVAALGFNNTKNEPVNEEFKFNWKRAKGKCYMISKHKGELYTFKYVNKGLNCMIANPGSMGGPGDMINYSKLIKAIKEKKIPFNMPGGNNLLDVRDVAKGLIKIMEKGKKGERYILSGYNYSLRKINDVIAKCVGAQPPKITIPRIFHKPLHIIFLIIENFSRNPPKLTSDTIDSSFMFRYFDNSKARRELNWKLTIPFSKSIKDSIEWLNKNQLM